MADTKDFERQAASTAPPVYRPPPVRRPGRPRKVRSPMGLSKKVKAACDLMVFDGLSREQAAKAVGLADGSLRLAFRNPNVLKHYNELIEVLRSGERPRSIHRIADLRDHSESDRVSLEAAKYLDGGPDKAGINVNVNVANIVPGYMVDVSGYAADPKLLNQSGSVANVLEHEGQSADD